MRHALRRSAVEVLLFAACVGPAVLRAQDTHSDGKPAAAAGATQSHATITLDFVRNAVGAPIPKYKLVIHDDGSGSYEGEALPPSTRYGPAAASAAVPFQRDLRLTSATTAHIFDLSAQLGHFNRDCASKAKNIADTGTKTLTYTGQDGSGSCTYNYTEIKELAALTETIQGITETLDMGRELDHLHRFDRLGLDAQISYLQQEVAAGRALELQTIGPTLRAIVEDTDVMARVRTKASAMLTQIAAAERDAAP